MLMTRDQKFILGFASGGILSLQQACAAQVATSTTLGLAIGTVSGATALSAMANVPISGALLENTEQRASSYRVMLGHWVEFEKVRGEADRRWEDRSKSKDD
ncbi:unnamed protein product [Penicillium roqueforti FM164]|uniref:Uncharacterized protein n=1 Tax=Penicillium roqueforti (strain FM164) TaxID=1365484 RepID=W6R731_PENRF|nr:unnamed protein product [Penicillium roqueforti FM164]